MVHDDGVRAAAEFITYLVRDEGLPAARGQRYILPAGAFLAIRDGHIAQVTTCYNLQDWLAQVK